MTESKARTTVPSPMKSIRLHCLECCWDRQIEVRECSATDCPTFHFRLNKKPKGESSFRAIRTMCMDCAGAQPSEVSGCLIVDCALYPYRMGKSLTRGGQPATPAQLANLSKARSLQFTSRTRASAETPPQNTGDSSIGISRGENDVVGEGGEPTAPQSPTVEAEG